MNLSNHTTLIGSLLRDPELYQAPGEPARAKFTLLQRRGLPSPASRAARRPES